MVQTEGIEIPRAMLHGLSQSPPQKGPVLRGDVPDSVEDVIEVPVPLAGADDDDVHILYVDDNTELTELTKTYLEGSDEAFSVMTATNAVEAIELLQNEEFDCVVSDYDMPNTDGIELLHIVRETHANLPFILFTAKGAEDVASEAFAAGATDYMQKGVGSDQYEILADRIQRAVDQYRTQQQVWNALSWYRTLVEQNFAGVFIVQDGEFVFVNQRLADILGYCRRELAGRVPTALASGPEGEARLRELAEFDRTPGKTFHVEATVSTSDGETLPVEIRGGVIHHDGEFGCIGLFWRRHDVC
jgi:PAS domain S-box-containing protein